ncbi:hypothetical protein Tco_0425981 [Tanacetum coccineum]
MEISIADQIALDDALVAPANRLKIGKFNLRLSSDVTSNEATLQVVYDVLKLTPFYKAFQVSTDVPEIYVQEFWASAYVHNRSVRFKMNNKKHILNLDQFRDILQICPKVGNKKFEETPPLENEIPFLAFQPVLERISKSKRAKTSKNQQEMKRQVQERDMRKDIKAGSARQQEKKVNEDPIKVKGSIMTSFQKFKGSFGCFESPRTKDVKVRKLVY